MASGTSDRDAIKEVSCQGGALLRGSSQKQGPKEADNGKAAAYYAQLFTLITYVCLCNLLQANPHPSAPFVHSDGTCLPLTLAVRRRHEQTHCLPMSSQPTDFASCTAAASARVSTPLMKVPFPTALHRALQRMYLLKNYRLQISAQFQFCTGPPVSSCMVSTQQTEGWSVSTGDKTRHCLPLSWSFSPATLRAPFAGLGLHPFASTHVRWEVMGSHATYHYAVMPSSPF